MRQHGWLGVALLVGAVAGCEGVYVYRPAERATAQVAGHTAAFYDVPQGQAHGDVRVASFGISKVTTATQKDIPAMHVRFIVENNSDGPWHLDTTDLRAQFAGGFNEGPTYVKSDAGGVPRVEVPAYSKRTIDLFYALPEGMRKAKRIPEFDLVWRLQVGDTTVVQRTPFERLRVEPLYAYGGTNFMGYYTWGPYGWYDPSFGPGTIGIPGWYWW